MAANNLRVIYQNIADLSTTTITASSTASGTTTAANLVKDSKSLVWRSGTSSSVSSIKANLVVSFASGIVGGVVLPFTNLSPNATMRVRIFTGTTPTMGGTVDSPTISTAGASLVVDTGFVACCPYQQLGLWNWGNLPLGVNSYSYGGGTYARDWFTPVTGTSAVIEIVDNRAGLTSPDMFIEASRLVIGSYWSPKYNTSFGLSTQMKDLSTHERSESGDLVTNRGVRFNSMNFDLNWLVPADRLEFTRIVKGNGLPRPLLISLFPDNSTDWDKEQSHQIYGKLSELAQVTHPIFDMYSTTIAIEEI